MAKTRALYDAPFTRGLISFDCAVQFDWKQHFLEVLPSIPGNAIPTIERLQAVQHRVFVDPSGAVVSAIPKAPDLAGTNHGTSLEQSLTAMVSSGLNMWMPSSTNVMLPVGSTKFHFEKIDTGYALIMNGPGINAKLQLSPDMRLTSGVTELPQPMHFSTKFTEGPEGFVLSSIKTGATSEMTARYDASVLFTYQAVQGIQIPASISVIPPTPETWNYALTDCKVNKGVVIRVGPPGPSTRQKTLSDTLHH